MAAAVQLGCRWRPGPIERRDTLAGLFESVNPLAVSDSDIAIQRAFLAPVTPGQAERIEAARQARRITPETRTK